MDTFPIRQILGLGWFYLLVFATATVVVSTDADVGSLGSALSQSNFSEVLVFSLPIALAAIPSFILFLQRRWVLGGIVALASGAVVWGAIQMLQITSSPLTLLEALALLPEVALMLGSWAVIVSLPAALLLSRCSAATEEK